MGSKRVKKYLLVTLSYVGFIVVAVLILFQTGTVSSPLSKPPKPTPSASVSAAPELLVKFDKATVESVPPADQVCKEGVCTYLKNGPQFSTDKKQLLLSAEPYKYFTVETIPLTGGQPPEDNPVSLGVLDLQKFSSGNYRLLVSTPNGPSWLFNLEITRD